MTPISAAVAAFRAEEARWKMVRAPNLQGFWATRDGVRQTGWPSCYDYDETMPHFTVYRDTACMRAAIAVLREPSEGMVLRARNEFPPEIMGSEITAAWRTMIDTLLAEGDGG